MYIHVHIHLCTFTQPNQVEVGIMNNMRRWWRLGKIVCMCIYHKYTLVLVYMHLCMSVMYVCMYVGWWVCLHVSM